MDIACGSGKQVLVAGFLNPDIEFIGIDGTAEHIAEAVEYTKALALGNVRFEQADLRSYAPIAASFDIITCSGTLSWVSEEAQTAILNVIQLGLSADGIAAVHFLTLPACGAFIEAKRVVEQHTQAHASVPEKLDAIATYAKTLGSVSDSDDDSRRETQVRRILNRFLDEGDHSVVHELLSADISAWFLRDFANRVAGHGLNLVADADFARCRPAFLQPGPITTMYERSESWIEQQELIDMFGGSGGSRMAILSRHPRAEGAVNFTFTGLQIRLRRWVMRAREADRIQVSPDRYEQLSASEIALLDELVDVHPESLPFESFPPEGRDAIIVRLMELGMVSMSALPVAYPSWAARKPKLFAFSRVEIDLASRDLTSRIGEVVSASPLAVYALSLCDGTRNLETLIALVSQRISAERSASSPLPNDRRWWLEKGNNASGDLKPDIEAERLLRCAHELGFFH